MQRHLSTRILAGAAIACSVLPGLCERATAAETPAGQIAAMLADPAGVRQAIVLSEILNRPSDRW